MKSDEYSGNSSPPPHPLLSPLITSSPSLRMTSSLSTPATTIEGAAHTQASASSLDAPLIFSSEPSRPQHHLLRILIVDDNAVNLALLGKLLRKKFAHLLDGPPIAVDSALKALQLLQENVYDLILMDIQMPFLSGVDCTRRIRDGSDRVLEANRRATIVAVTTAVGSEPELLYRRAGFDGLMGKPVKFEVMKELLEPLLAAAQAAAPKVTPLNVNGNAILPPLPVVPAMGQRCFFLAHTSNADVLSSSTAPSITKTSNFEALLKEQTRISLFRYGACAIARTNSAIGVSDRRRIRDYDYETTPPRSSSPASEDDKQTMRRRVVTGDTEGDADVDGHVSLVRVASADPSPKWSRSRRGASLTISQSSLNEQIHREMQAAQLQVPTYRARHSLHATRLSVPTIITKTPATDEEDTAFALDTASKEDLFNAAAIDEDIVADEPLSPFSHFGNSGGNDPGSNLFEHRQRTQPSSPRRSSSPLKVRPSLAVLPGNDRWMANRAYSSECRRSSSTGCSSSSAESSSPMSGPSSRSGSMATEGEDGDEGATPLTTPDREYALFPLASIAESKVLLNSTDLPDLPRCPRDSSPSADSAVETIKSGARDSCGNQTTPRMRTSPWRPPLERQTATREVLTVSKVLNEHFRDFQL